MWTKAVTGLRVPVLVAVIALLAATASAAAGPAKPGQASGEVDVFTISGGPVDTTDPYVAVPIPLAGLPEYSFTQVKGEVVQLITYATAEKLDYPEADMCDLAVYVWDTGLGVGTTATFATDRGELAWSGGAINAIPASTEDRTITLQAAAQESAVGCDQEVWTQTDPPVLDDEGPDTWRVWVTVTVVRLRP